MVEKLRTKFLVDCFNEIGQNNCPNLDRMISRMKNHAFRHGLNPKMISLTNAIESVTYELARRASAQVNKLDQKHHLKKGLTL